MEIARILHEYEHVYVNWSVKVNEHVCVHEQYETEHAHESANEYVHETKI